MEIFATMPGLPGLFVACAFSGTLRLVCRQAEDGNDGGGSGDDDLTDNDNDGDGSSDDKPTGMMTVMISCLLSSYWVPILPAAMLYFSLIIGTTQHVKKNLHSHSHQFADKETDLIRMRDTTNL